jgi:hypothetical protein
MNWKGNGIKDFIIHVRFAVTSSLEWWLALYNYNQQRIQAPSIELPFSTKDSSMMPFDFYCVSLPLLHMI